MDGTLKRAINEATRRALVLGKHYNVYRSTRTAQHIIRPANDAWPVGHTLVCTIQPEPEVA